MKKFLIISILGFILTIIGIIIVTTTKEYYAISPTKILAVFIFSIAFLLRYIIDKKKDKTDDNVTDEDQNQDK